MAGDDTILSGNRMEEEQNKAYYFLDRVPESPEGLPVGENFPDLPVVLPAGETGPTADLPVVLPAGETSPVPALPVFTPAGESQAVAKRKRGRPELIDDCELLSRRQSVLSIVEAHWGELGWKLTHARNPIKVREAFQALSGEPSLPYVIEALLRPSDLPATSEDLIALKKAAAKIADSLAKSQEHQQQCREALQIAMTVPTSALPPEQKALVQEEQSRLRSAFEKAESEHLRLQQQWRDLGERLRDSQAHFAREEVSRFRSAAKYAIIPINVANALAGLPDLGYRQSIKRCRAFRPLDPIYKDVVPQNLQGGPYHVFLTIRRIINSLPRKQLLIEHAHRWLSTKKAKPGSAIQEMQNSWYYLSRAITAAIEVQPRPSALPYRILSEYQRRIQNKTPLDRLLEGRERIIRVVK